MGRPVSDDTAGRSLSHWSEAGREEMNAFYALASLDYEMLAGALDWPAFLSSLGAERGTALTLLDVACGSGKFPTALVRYAGVGVLESLRYDLLDPSPFSLDEAAGALRPPFVEGNRFQTTLQGLATDAGPWDIVWATHALYALEPANLGAAVTRYLGATAPRGVSFLAQGSVESFYLQVYAAFLTGVRNGAGTQYLASEDLIGEFRAQGREPDVHRLAYDHVIAAEDTAVLEGYLQRCLFDDTLSLEDMLSAPVLGPFLAAQWDTDASVYRFHQEVDCVVLTPNDEGPVPWTAAS